MIGLPAVSNIQITFSRKTAPAAPMVPAALFSRLCRRYRGARFARAPMCIVAECGATLLQAPFQIMKLALPEHHLALPDHQLVLPVSHWFCQSATGFAEATLSGSNTQLPPTPSNSASRCARSLWGLLWDCNATGRHRGDSDPCGQSPMDFEPISLTARTQAAF